MAAWEERLSTEFNMLNNWIKVSRVICDKRVPVKLKGKVNKSVVRPAMTYGLEIAPLRKVEERKLDVAEMKMLRWMVGVTKMDCIRNNYIRGSLKVTEISKNVQESRLRFMGHLLKETKIMWEDRQWRWK
ncbi:uncharacterized protein LOC119572508 [Penaeus monodon]|uniref:uncharacterized protein LOC119572508 n=1 Tax=Penaeus monodon TaxID=6687 RepID=UPI0018A79C0A|nr:uncharacterized protein LOC119572508 [Penaeus monodon]